MKDNWKIDHGWFVIEKGTTVHRCPRCRKAFTIGQEGQYDRWIGAIWQCPCCYEALDTKQVNEGKVH